MTTTTGPKTAIPPLCDWTLGRARWLDETTLESDEGQFETLLHSPAFTLEPGFHVLRLNVDIDAGPEGLDEDAAITFGLQDGDMTAWLQQTSTQGTGPGICELQVRLRKAESFRLVVANCRRAGTGCTTIRGLELGSVASDSDTPFDNEHWKNEVRRQWNTDHCGHDRGEGHDKGSLEYFTAVEKDRYGSYAPWMPEAIGFHKYGGKKLIEIGGGLGTDLAQFAKAGAHVTDFDLAEGHLNLAKRNFEVRGLPGEFILGDGEKMDLADASFDVVYSFGVIHHTPETQRVVDHFHRLLKPGGEAIIMVYAKHSWNYWVNVVYRQWFRQGLRRTMSIDDVLSAYTECSPNGARPLVKVYTARQCRQMFGAFSEVRIRKFQLTPGEIPGWMRAIASADKWGRLMGWNLVINAIK